MKNRTFNTALIMCLILSACLLAVLGCASGAGQPDKVYPCKTDQDCIPKPGCHPTECINRKYENLFAKPDVCTKIFMSQAAYSKEDCACTAGLCANKNMAPEKKNYTEAESQEIANGYIQQSSTYRFDGSNLQFKQAVSMGCSQCWYFLFDFQCSHPGYGDRSGQVLPQIATPHSAIISVEKGRVSTAILDRDWDMIRQETIQAVLADQNEAPGKDIPTEEETDTYCASDSDCACGRSIVTGDCFYGNAEFVDTSEQCPDFCTGIAANLQIRCISNKCQQLQIPR